MVYNVCIFYINLIALDSNFDFNDMIFLDWEQHFP